MKLETSNAQNNNISTWLILLFGMIITLTPIAMDMYIPAMPQMADSFNTTPKYLQHSLQLFLFGFMLGQLLIGPLSDAFGRRKLLLAGILIYTVSSFIITINESITMFNILRVFQGIGGASCSVNVYAIVRDKLEKNSFASVLSFISIVMMVAPLVSPAIGGNISGFFGWHAVFWVMAVYSVLLLVLAFSFIAESLSIEKRHELSLLTVCKNYISIFKNYSAGLYIISAAMSFSGVFIFINMGSFIYGEIYGFSEQNVGYLFSLNIVTMLIFTATNAKTVKTIGPESMAYIYIILQVLAGMYMIAGFYFGLGLWSLLPGIMVFCGANTSIYSNLLTCVMHSQSKIAGTAAALFSAVCFGGASVICAFVSHFGTRTEFPMILAMFICSVLAMIVYSIARITDHQQ